MRGDAGHAEIGGEIQKRLVERRPPRLASPVREKGREEDQQDERQELETVHVGLLEGPRLYFFRGFQAFLLAARARRTRIHLSAICWGNKFFNPYSQGSLMRRIQNRLKSIFRTRRSNGKKELDASQSHTLRQNLRAILTSKEFLAQQKKPTPGATA
jgi:hypothetical protein